MTKHYLSIITEKLPAIDRIIAQYGDMTLAEYGQTLIPKAIPTYQPRDDLLEIVYQYVAPLLGESIAKQAAHDLDVYPMVLTTNHHGVEYFSQTFQARLLFALNALRNRASVTTVSAFACGNVPLNTATYPQGLLFYHTNSSHLEVIPQKLRVFPNKFRRCRVSTAPAFTRTMVNKCTELVKESLNGQKISPTLSTAIYQIIKEDYCDVSVLSQTSYSQQAVILNNRIWRRLFPEMAQLPDVVYLDTEKITSILLYSDLRNPNSLVWRVLFDAELRQNVLHELDGTRSCWERQKLAQRVQMNVANGSKKSRLPGGGGTIFFWGIDRAKRGFPLHLETNASGESILCGVDETGHLWKIPFTPLDIIQRLQEQTLLPSLFICFLALSFARGITCVGGYFQYEYLPSMQQGLITALKNSTGYEDVAQLVAQIPTRSYIDGMAAVMTKIGKDSLVPAGPVEIIAGGGINYKELEQIASLTVRDAHVADLFDTLSDVLSAEQLHAGWKKQLATESFQALQDKVLIK